MILKIINTETDEVLLEDEFTEEEISDVLPNWNTQVQLYSIQSPPINARLEILEE